MWGKIMIPMYRLWLHDIYGLYGPRCPLSPERPLNLIIHSLTLSWAESEGAVAGGNSSWWGSSELGRVERGGCRRQLPMVRVLWVGWSVVGVATGINSTWLGTSGPAGVWMHEFALYALCGGQSLVGRSHISLRETISIVLECLRQIIKMVRLSLSTVQ